MSLTSALNQPKTQSLMPHSLLLPMPQLALSPPRMPSHNLPNKKYIPRPFQHEITEKVMSTFAEGVYHRVAYTSPTGTGKTPILAEVIRRLWSPGHPAIVLVHSDHLLSQAQKTIKAVAPGLRVEIEKAEQVASDDADVILCSIQSFARWSSKRYLRLIAAVPSCIVYDECHHAASKQAKILFERLQIRENKIPMLGCTATAIRLDKKTIIGDEEDAPFQVLVAQYTLLSAMRDKAVCTIRGYRIVTDTDISGVTVTKSMNELERDFHRGELSAVVRSGGRTAQCYERWSEVAAERQTIIFCVDIAHAESVYAYWKEKGVACGLVHSATDENGNFSVEANRQTRDKYSRGELRVIVNVGMLTEGYDDPPTSCVLLMRPTMSLMCYLQMIGRAYRLFAGKEDCLIIDTVDNYKEHSLTQDDNSNPVQGEGQGKVPDYSQDKPQATGKAPRASKRKLPNSSAGEEVDIVKGQTLGSAAGLDPSVDIGNSTLLEAAEIAERMTEKQKARRYNTLADIITYLQEIDLVGDEAKSRANPDYSVGTIHGNWKIIGRGQSKTNHKGEARSQHRVECTNCHLVASHSSGSLLKIRASNTTGKCRHNGKLETPLLGSVYGHLTVISTETQSTGRGVEILCRCNYNGCSKERYIRVAHLLDGALVTCGQHKGLDIPPVGSAFGYLTVVDNNVQIIGTVRTVLCKCHYDGCGKQRYVAISRLVKGRLKTCGQHKASFGAVHGNLKTRLWQSWVSLKAGRQDSMRQKGQQHMYEPWTHYVQFREWVLAQGGNANCTVRKIKYGLPYTPENCRVVHPEVKTAAGEIVSPAA